MKRGLLRFYFIVVIGLLLTVVNCNAQLIAEAGGNSTICKGLLATLGGNPTATGGHPPYQYHWFPTSALSSDSVANPTALPIVTTTYYLTVTDDSLYTKTDSIVITVTPKYNLYITASDTEICAGEVIQLNTNVQTGCLTASCVGNNLSVIGTGNVIQPGTQLQPPTLFGNYLKSNRNQMLYKASELQAALGGPQLIKAITFNIGLFNSNAFLLNFSVKMGCVSLDSLTGWENNLVQVYSSTTPYQPQPGWSNGISLTTPIYWDGISDLIVDICHYNPNTFGNQNNKASCSYTPFASYLYSSGNLNQCSGYTTPSKSYLRPNIQFNYCTPTSNPVPTQLSVTNNWFPSSGAQQVSDAHAVNPTAAPNTTTIYSLQISDAFGCAESDSITIHVFPSNVSASINIDNQFCPGMSQGTITALLNAVTDSLQYALVNSSYSDTLYYGVVADGTVNVFPNIVDGVYHLLLSDSVCSNIDYPISVVGFPAMSISSPATANVNCYGDSTGSACVSVSGGTPPYHYLWDSLPSLDSCFHNFYAGNHSVIIIDSNNCSQSFLSFPVYSLPPISILIAYDTTTYGVAVTITGGQSGYTINWGDSSSGYSTYYAYHAYHSTGTFYIKITDLNGCEILDSVFVLYTSINETEEQIGFRIFPNPATTELNIQIDETLLGAQLNIYNITGALMQTATLSIQHSALNIQQFPSGVYIAEVNPPAGRAGTKEATLKRRWVKM